MANSIIDYIFRVLGVEYLQRDELVQIPPDRSLSDLPEPPKGIAAEAGHQMELLDTGPREVKPQRLSSSFESADVPGTRQQPGFQMTLPNANSVPAENMGDAPACRMCGHMTVRSGSCYTCLNCGDTSGCS